MKKRVLGFSLVVCMLLSALSPIVSCAEIVCRSNPNYTERAEIVCCSNPNYAERVVNISHAIDYYIFHYAIKCLNCNAIIEYTKDERHER